MALYATACARERHLANVRAFMVHSSGLKVKGDGVAWPQTFSDHGAEVGECDTCDFYPVVPRKSEALAGTKLCLYDGTEDFSGGTNYTASSWSLANYWPQTGGEVEVHMQPGFPHVKVLSWSAILKCLRNETDVGKALL